MFKQVLGFILQYFKCLLLPQISSYYIEVYILMSYDFLIQNEDYDLLGNEKDEVGATARDIEANRRANNIWDNNKEEEIEEYYRCKYAEQSSAAAR